MLKKYLDKLSRTICDILISLDKNPSDDLIFPQYISHVYEGPVVVSEQQTDNHYTPIKVLSDSREYK